MSGIAEFVREVAPYAQAVARETGLAPETIIAQWGLETGWGSSTLYKKGKNLAGIKATPAWIGPIIGEYRAYPSLAAAAADYARIMSNKLYERVRKSPDPYSQALALGSSPWAEDPAYGAKLVSLIPKVQETLRSVSTSSLPPLNLSGTGGLLSEEELRKQRESSVWETLTPEEKRVVEEDLYRPGADAGAGSWLMTPVRHILRWILILAVGLAALYSAAQALAPEVQAVVGAAADVAKTARKVVGK